MPGLQLVLMSERFTKRAKHGRIVKLLLHVKRKDENVLKVYICLFSFNSIIIIIIIAIIIVI